MPVLTETADDFFERKPLIFCLHYILFGCTLIFILISFSRTLSFTLKTCAIHVFKLSKSIYSQFNNYTQALSLYSVLLFLGGVLIKNVIALTFISKKKASKSLWLILFISCLYWACCSLFGSSKARFCLYSKRGENKL